MHHRGKPTRWSEGPHARLTGLAAAPLAWIVFRSGAAGSFPLPARDVHLTPCIERWISVMHEVGKAAAASCGCRVSGSRGPPPQGWCCGKCSTLAMPPL